MDMEFTCNSACWNASHLIAPSNPGKARFATLDRCPAEATSSQKHVVLLDTLYNQKDKSQIHNTHIVLEQLKEGIIHIENNPDHLDDIVTQLQSLQQSHLLNATVFREALVCLHKSIVSRCESTHAVVLHLPLLRFLLDLSHQEQTAPRLLARLILLHIASWIDLTGESYAASICMNIKASQQFKLQLRYSSAQVYRRFTRKLVQLLEEDILQARSTYKVLAMSIFASIIYVGPCNSKSLMDWIDTSTMTAIGNFLYCDAPRLSENIPEVAHSNFVPIFDPHATISTYSADFVDRISSGRLDDISQQSDENQHHELRHAALRLSSALAHSPGKLHRHFFVPKVIHYLMTAAMCGEGPIATLKLVMITLRGIALHATPGIAVTISHQVEEAIRNSLPRWLEIELRVLGKLAAAALE